MAGKLREATLSPRDTADIPLTLGIHALFSLLFNVVSYFMSK